VKWLVNELVSWMGRSVQSQVHEGKVLVRAVA